MSIQREIFRLSSPQVQHTLVRSFSCFQPVWHEPYSDGVSAYEGWHQSMVHRACKVLAARLHIHPLRHRPAREAYLDLFEDEVFQGPWHLAVCGHLDQPSIRFLLQLDNSARLKMVKALSKIIHDRLAESMKRFAYGAPQDPDYHTFLTFELSHSRQESFATQS